MKEFIIRALYDTCTTDHIDTIKKSIDNIDFDDPDSIRNNLTDAEIDDICYAVEKCDLNINFECEADRYVADEIISKLADVRVSSLFKAEQDEMIIDEVPF